MLERANSSGYWFWLVNGGSCGGVGSFVYVLGVNSTEKERNWFLCCIGSEGGIYPSECYHFLNGFFDLRKCFFDNSFCFYYFFKTMRETKKIKEINLFSADCVLQLNGLQMKQKLLYF